MKADIRSHWESIGDLQEFVSEIEVFLNESDLRESIADINEIGQLGERDLFLL